MSWGERPSPALSVRSSLVVVAAAVALLGSLLPHVAAPVLADDGTVATVHATEFVPRATPPGSDRPTAREIENARVTAPRAHARPGTVAAGEPLVVGRATTAQAPSLLADPIEGASAMTFEQNGFSDDEFGTRTTLAVLGTRSMTASRQELRFYRTGTFGLIDYTGGLDGFFNVPSSEYWWGATVVASIKQGRFVTVLPTFQGQSRDCAKGYLNVAVSRSSNPMGSWYRYRIPMTDAWTDDVRIGLSDDKVVLSANEWDLNSNRSDCLGSTYEGARLRVMDWADLLNGGALTVKDVSPTPRTSYWTWMPAVNVPGTTSTSAGKTIRLVGDRKATTWGHVAYSTITGSAKSGTAKLVGNADLTAKRGLHELHGPPATILAMASGNGGLDEAVTSVTARGSRLYFTANDSCKLDEDTDFRSCGRIVELNTSTTLPTVIQDVASVDLGQDTFLPYVGVARDGTVFVVMSRSSATSATTTDHYVSYRSPGEPFYGGAPEQVFERGTDRPTGTYGTQGSVVPDPVNMHRVIAEYAHTTASGPGALPTAFVGNLTTDPGGTFAVGLGTGWATSQYATVGLHPDPASPTMWVRWSASPGTTDTAGGPMLTHGSESASVPAVLADFAGADLGGAPADPYTVYVQWRTGDGRWSAPIAQEINVDAVAPVITAPSRRFATGSVSATLPLHLEWPAATDDEAGVMRIDVNRYDTFGGDQPLQATLGPAATAVNVRAHPASPSVFELQVLDLAGNGASAQTPSFTIRPTEDTSSSVKYSSGWTRASSSKSTGKTVHYATRAGARATFTFTGRAIAFVSTKGPRMGKAELWLDGVKAGTVDLYRSSTAYRQLVWEAHWDASATHTVVVRVLGTSGRPRVDVDEFLRF